MRVYDFLRSLDFYTKLIVADFDSDKILINEQTSHTPKGNIKKIFKEIEHKTIILLYAYADRKIKIFIN